MTVTPIHAIQYLAKGAKLEAIEGTLTKIYEERKLGTNEHGNWSFQDAKLRGACGNEIKVKFSNMDPIPANWAGHPVRFVASSDAKAKSVVVDVYKDIRRIEINNTATFEWNPEGYGAGATTGPAQNAPQSAPQGPSPSQHTGPPAQSPPAQRQTPPPQQQQHQQQQRPAPTGPPAGRMPLHGPTAGMAVKMAGDIILQNPSEYDPAGSEAWARSLFILASDIVRVCKRLEDGYLAPAPSARAARKPPTTDRQIEPDHSHDPVQNERERLENARRHAQDHPSEPEHGDRQRPPVFDPDADEIPF